MPRNRIDMSIELAHVHKEYVRLTKGHTEDEKFDTPETRQLHECCRQAQLSLGEDPMDMELLRHRGFIDGNYDKAVKALIADCKKGERWTANDAGKWERASVE